MERILPGDPTVEPHFLSKLYVEHSNRYHFAAAFVKGRRVLDVGCGVGYGSAMLAARGASEVRGIDISPEAIQHAQQKYSSENVQFSIKDAANLPFEDASFDVVVCLETIEHVEDYRAAMEEICRVLKLTGLLVISSPRFRGRMITEYHVQEFLYDEFTGLLRRYFEHLQLFQQNPSYANFIEPVGTTDDRLELRPLRLVQFDASNSDKFLALASRSELPAEGRAFASIADDDYIVYLEEERSFLKKDWAEKEELIRELRENIDDLGKTATNRLKEIGALEARCEAAEADAQSLRRQTEHLRASIEEGRTHLALVSERLQHQREASQDALAARESAHRECESLREQLAASRGEAQRRLESAERASRELERLQRTFEEHRQRTATLSEEKERDYDRLQQRYESEMQEILDSLREFAAPKGDT